jgi:MFS family permease
MTSLRLIALLTVLLHLAFAGARVTLSLFALHLGASAATVGILVSLLALVPMFFAVKWGRYVDRVGVRGPMADRPPLSGSGTRGRNGSRPIPKTLQPVFRARA